VTVHTSTVFRWVLWVGLFVIAIPILIHARVDIEQSHVVLTLLLIALGGSASGGRVLGFALAIGGFLVLDLYFQRPFGHLWVHKPFDALVLAAFLASAGLATDLLARARAEAEATRQRASEVESLSRLGAATLRYAQPADSLGALTDLVRETLGASSCSIVRAESSQELTIVSRAADIANAPQDSQLELRAAAHAIETAAPVTLSANDVCLTHDGRNFTNSASRPLVTTVLALPLQADERIIGALTVRGNPVLVLDAGLRRFLAALGYYAALGLERARLFEQAAHSEALREANRAKDQILASVSHDLRTPLTTIKVLAQGAEARGERSGTAIVEQADRLERMVRDLLDLSRLRTGNSSVTPELNTAEDLVGALLRQSAGVLGSKSVVPHIDLSSPVLVGSFDFVHTLRILGNLVDNALRYTPEAGVVDLHARREGDELVLTVSDRGAGVAPDEQQRIFEAFYRPAGATPDAGRSGLGLSIARTLAELQGGSLTYAARVGGGSVFTLRLPAADVEELS
jgi:two-component system sensor histidine kinase KdpD